MHGWEIADLLCKLKLETFFSHGSNSCRCRTICNSNTVNMYAYSTLRNISLPFLRVPAITGSRGGCEVRKGTILLVRSWVHVHVSTNCSIFGVCKNIACIKGGMWLETRLFSLECFGTEVSRGAYAYHDIIMYLVRDDRQGLPALLNAGVERVDNFYAPLVFQCDGRFGGIQGERMACVPPHIVTCI